MDYSQLINDILNNIGGCENIQSVTHCATRLRFILKKPDKANSEALNKNPHIIMVVSSIGQYQLVIGPEVNEVHEKLIKHCPQLSPDLPITFNGQPPIQRLITNMTDAFKPFINILLMCALMKVVIAALNPLNIQLEKGTYHLLYAASDSIFYFLPILLAYTMAKRFKANPYVAIVISASLFHPTSAESLYHLFNTSTLAHTTPNVTINDGFAVLPLLAMTWGLSLVQKQLEQRIFITIRTLFVPTICILLFVPITFTVMKPTGHLLGQLIIELYHLIYLQHPFIIGILLTGLWPLIVICGLQWALGSLILTHFYIHGSDPILPLIACALIGQSGAALGICLKKNQSNKGFTRIASLVCFCGIVEPVLYGCNLPDKKALIIGSIGAMIGSMAVTFSHFSSHTDTLPGVFLILQHIHTIHTNSSLYLFLFGIVLSFLTAMTGRFFWPDNNVAFQNESTSETLPNISKQHAARSQLIPSPLTGRLINQNEIDDFIFSDTTLGTGVAVYPDQNTLYSPIDGKVEKIFEGNHAISLISHDGIKILIHIGLKTVQLTGKYFSSQVSQDEHIHIGQPLIQFDHDAIQQAGFDLTTPILVTNSHLYQQIDPAQFSHINQCSPLLVLTNDDISDENA